MWRQSRSLIKSSHIVLNGEAGGGEISVRSTLTLPLHRKTEGPSYIFLLDTFTAFVMSEDQLVLTMNTY